MMAPARQGCTRNPVEDVDDDTFDASMATISVHQWHDAAAGLREMRRVSRGPVVVLTFDGAALDRFWLADHVPELIETIREVLGGRSEVTPVDIPVDCTDGFTEAFYARPERFLLEAVRRAQSAWGFVITTSRRVPSHISCVISTTAHGSGDTDTCARSRPTTGRSAWWWRGRDHPGPRVALDRCRRARSPARPIAARPVASNLC